MRKLLQVALVVVILVGLVFAWRTGQKRGEAQGEYDRLVRLTGDMPITDPNKIHVLALETDESLHFAWRIYLPPNCRFVVRHNSGGSSMSSHTEPQQFLARIRFREQADGRLQVFTKFHGGSSQSGFGDESLADFLRGRWDRIDVEQLGSGKVAVFPREEQVVLLRLTLPETLQGEAEKQLDARRLEEKLPLLYESRIGPNSAKL
jgi:hypothetical protein